MSPVCRTPIAIALSVVLATLSCVGEGLHLIPGLGHRIVFRDLAVSWGAVGIDEAGVRSAPTSGKTANTVPGPWRSPLLDASQCPICDHFAQSGAAAPFVQWSVAHASVGRRVRSAGHWRPAAELRSFLVRGPPVV
jgi:hypothetical protein